MPSCPRCNKDRPPDDFADYDYRCRTCRCERTFDYSRTPRGQYTNARAIAKRRNLSFDITRSQYADLRSEPCRYCGGDLPPTGVGLDRLDNASGYLLSNVVPSCGLCNHVRSDHFTHEEMLTLGRVISHILKARPGNK